MSWPGFAAPLEGNRDDMNTPRARKQYSSSIMAPPVDTSDRLAKMSLFYHREAERCIGERAYFAACILTAAALEAILLSMCYVEDRAVRRAAAYKQKRFKFARNRFLEFNLYQLIGIAAELKWIPSNEIRVNGRKTTLEELLHYGQDNEKSDSPRRLGQGRRPRQDVQINIRIHL
jgi:hypothetical protein